MTNVSFKRGLSENLENLPIEDGQVIITTDKGELYIDLPSNNTIIRKLIVSGKGIEFEVVQQLPTTNIKTNVIYLVPKSTTQTQNVYDEYIYANNHWEKIGDTQIDLSGKEDKSNKVTILSAQSTDIQYPSAKVVYDSLKNKVDKAEGKGLSTNDYTTVEKTKLAGIEAGAEVNNPVDQTYDPTSENAQSGIAVAKGIDQSLGDIEEVLDLINHGIYPKPIPLPDPDWAGSFENGITSRVENCGPLVGITNYNFGKGLKYWGSDGNYSPNTVGNLITDEDFNYFQLDPEKENHGRYVGLRSSRIALPKEKVTSTKNYTLLAKINDDSQYTWQIVFGSVSHTPAEITIRLSNNANPIVSLDNGWKIYATQVFHLNGSSYIGKPNDGVNPEDFIFYIRLNSGSNADSKTKFGEVYLAEIVGNKYIDAFTGRVLLSRDSEV